jgi:hypothetical protein
LLDFVPDQFMCCYNAYYHWLQGDLGILYWFVVRTIFKGDNMKIKLGSHTLETTLTVGWKERVIREVEKTQRLYPLHYGIKTFDDGTNAKIQRIKAVRQLAAWFPEDEREYGGAYDESGNALLSLSYCKEFVETNWAKNGYGDPVL